MRACKLRAALGRSATETIGALGISSETGDDSGNERRTATSAPPAETFNTVANSSKSLPFSSRLRMKTGIASRKRGHLRRSVSRLRRFKMRSHPSQDRSSLTAPWGPNKLLAHLSKPSGTWKSAILHRKMGLGRATLRGMFSLYLRFSQRLIFRG